MKEEEEEGGGGRGRSRAGAGLSPNCAGESATLYSPSSHGLAPQHPPHPKCPQHGPEQNPRRETTPVPSFAEPQQHPEYQGSAQGLLQAIENPNLGKETLQDAHLHPGSMSRGISMLAPGCWGSKRQKLMRSVFVLFSFPPPPWFIYRCCELFICNKSLFQPGPGAACVISQAATRHPARFPWGHQHLAPITPMCVGR